MLELREIHKPCPQGGETVPVLHGISMEVQPGLSPASRARWMTARVPLANALSYE